MLFKNLPQLPQKRHTAVNCRKTGVLQYFLLQSSFSKFKRRNPEKFSSLTNRVLEDLTEFEKSS
jgi:hypothetical protein